MRFLKPVGLVILLALPLTLWCFESPTQDAAQEAKLTEKVSYGRAARQAARSSDFWLQRRDSDPKWK